MWYWLSLYCGTGPCTVALAVTVLWYWSLNVVLVLALITNFPCAVVLPILCTVALYHGFPYAVASIAAQNVALAFTVPWSCVLQH